MVFVSIDQLRLKAHQRQMVRRPNAATEVIRTANIGKERAPDTAEWRSGSERAEVNCGEEDNCYGA
jgi:hypothetical protein